MTTSHLAARAFVLIAIAGCGGGDGGADAGMTRDGGPIDRRSPEDVDGDQWLNAADNCPMIANPEQRDRDRDGVGDGCDSCPATPNGGTNGQLAQSACEIIDEVEPNDATGQTLVAKPVGSALAVRGVIEPTAGSDRYQLMLGARTLLHLRVARAGMTSLLEPSITVTGGTFETPRTAEGLFVAEREIYVSSAGVYDIVVSDRRQDGEIGGPLFGYELSVTAIEREPDGLTLPLVDRKLLLTPRGTVGIYEIDLAAAQRTRVIVESPISLRSPSGIDPIVVVEAPDGTLVAENDDFVGGKRDARYFGPIPAGRARIVVDHAAIIGDGPLELDLTIDQPPENFEVEPNDTPELASPLVFPGQSRGIIDPPIDGRADVDLWSFQATAGMVASFRALVDVNSQIDPRIVLGRYEGDTFRPLYTNDDSSGISARIDAILPVAGTYHLRLSDGRNDRPMAMPRGGVLFPYTLFTEPLGIQPAGELTTSGPISGVLNPGGALVRWLVTASVGPTLLELDTASVGVMDELTPYIRVYRPAARGVLGEGEEQAVAILPLPGSYPIAIHNAEEGKGGLNYSFTLDARMTPLAEAAEAEPNDAMPQRVDVLPAALLGRIESETDVDRFAFDLAAGARLDVLSGQPLAGMTLSLSRTGEATPVAEGEMAIRAYRAMAGEHVLSLSATRATDYAIAVRAR